MFYISDSASQEPDKELVPRSFKHTKAHSFDATFKRNEQLQSGFFDKHEVQEAKKSHSLLSEMILSEQEEQEQIRRFQQQHQNQHQHHHSNLYSSQHHQHQQKHNGLLKSDKRRRKLISHQHDAGHTNKAPEAKVEHKEEEKPSTTNVDFSESLRQNLKKDWEPLFNQIVLNQKHAQNNPDANFQFSYQPLCKGW